MKTCSPIRSNASTLLHLMLDRGMTAGEAAKQTGISSDLFGRLIRQDKCISYLTASKLKSVFGTAAIKINDPFQM